MPDLAEPRGILLASRCIDRDGKAGVGELEAEKERLSSKLTALEFSVAKDAKDYVNRIDLKEGLKDVEARLGKRLDDVEHAVRNSASQMMGAMENIFRDSVSRRGPAA